MNVTIEETESENAGAFKKSVTKSVTVTMDEPKTADDGDDVPKRQAGEMNEV